MNAEPRDQRRLLDLAELDARRRRAEHDRTTLPHAARLTDIAAAATTASRALAERQGARDDLRTELGRIEADVAVVDARIVRDGERLAATTSAKDAQGLEHELGALAKRKSDLEDGELVVMERVETVDGEVAALEQELASLHAEHETLDAQNRVHVAGAVARLDEATRDRDAIASELPADLVAAYERALRKSVGAALLRAGTCEGCRIVLPGTDLAAIRRAGSLDVVTCPECECILVRTEESGL